VVTYHEVSFIPFQKLSWIS